MRVSILVLGTEIFLQNKTDLNGPFLGGIAADLGWTVRFRCIVVDELQSFTESLTAAENLSDVIFITGGLGGTQDDCTIDFLAGHYGIKKLPDPEANGRLKDVYYKRYNETLAEERLKKHRGFDTLAGAMLIHNPVGIASGHVFSVPRTGNGKADISQLTAESLADFDAGRSLLFIILPGVPKENQAITAGLLPILEPLKEPGWRLSLTLFGVTETAFEQTFFENYKLPAGVEYGISFSIGCIRLNFWSGVAADVRDEIKERLFSLFDREAFVTDLDGELAEALVKSRAVLTTAESCTGGGIGARVTARAGSSAYFAGSWVTYSNINKTGELEVAEDVLAEHGAVSEEVVKAMAAGSLKKSRALYPDRPLYTIAVSGVAGPGGGTDDKPVGTVWTNIAYQLKPGGPIEHKPVKIYHPRDRISVQQYTIVYCLDQLRRLLNRNG